MARREPSVRNANSNCDQSESLSGHSQKAFRARADQYRKLAAEAPDDFLLEQLLKLVEAYDELAARLNEEALAS
jgi:hypothetical protein